MHGRRESGILPSWLRVTTTTTCCNKRLLPSHLQDKFLGFSISEVKRYGPKAGIRS